MQPNQPVPSEPPAPAEEAARYRHFEYLVATLRDLDPQARMQAARLLGETREPHAVVPLVEALHDPDSGVRQQAVNSLGKLGTDGVEGLIEAMHDPNPDVRQMAAKAISQLGDPTAIDKLVACLRDPQHEVRNQVAFALKKIGTRAVPALITALSHTDTSIRWGAARVLGEIGDARALPELERVSRQDVGRTPGTGALGTGPLVMNNVSDAARQAIEKIKRAGKR